MTVVGVVPRAAAHYKIALLIIAAMAKAGAESEGFWRGRAKALDRHICQGLSVNLFRKRAQNIMARVSSIRSPSSALQRAGNEFQDAPVFFLDARIAVENLANVVMACPTQASLVPSVVAPEAPVFGDIAEL